MNFPTTHPCYQGVQWNERRQNEALARADVVLVIDSDVPWIGAVSQPRDGARIFHIDADPLKQQMPLWYIGASAAMPGRRGAGAAQIRAALRGVRGRSGKTRRGAVQHLAAAHEAWQAGVTAREQPGDTLTRGISGGLHPRCRGRGRHRGQRIGDQLPRGLAAHAPHETRHAVLERRRLAGLQRRRGVRHQAGEAGCAGGGHLR